MASSLIGSLRVALGLDTAQFEAGARKSRSIAKGLSKDIESSFKSAKVAVEGLVAAFAIGALTEQIKKSLEFAAAIGETASTLGVTTKQLQEYRFAASQVGVSQEALEGSLQRLTVSMGKAEVGSQEQIKAFNAIGISVSELKGKNTGEVFEMIAEGLKNVTDRAQRAAIEVALFGKNGAQIDSLLSGGVGRLNALADAAHRLGVVLSEDEIKNAEVTAHKLEALQTVLEANIASTVTANANSILSLAQALSTLTTQILHFFSSHPQLALAIIGGLAGSRFGQVGAALGAGLGAFAGEKVAENQADANMNYAFRLKQLRNAEKEVARLRGEAQAGDTSILGGLITFHRGSTRSAGGLKSAQAELARQRKLFAEAGTAALQPEPSVAPGINLPQFLAPEPKKGRKPPADRSEELLAQMDKEILQANQNILQAKQSLAGSAEEHLQISVQLIALEKTIRDKGIDEEIAKARREHAEHKITDAALQEAEQKARTLKAASEVQAQVEYQALVEKELAEHDHDLVALSIQQLKFRENALRTADQLATTQADHRRIQLQILDAEIEQQRLQLEANKRDAIRNGLKKEQIDAIQKEIDQLPATRAQQAALIINSTRGPLEDFFHGIPDSAREVGQALESEAVKGLQDFNDQLVEAIMNSKSLAEVFHNVAASILADLLKIALQEAELAIFKSIMGGLSGGFNAGSFGGIESSNAASLGLPSDFFGADGGLIRGPGTSTSDSIPARLSNGEFVINAKAVRSVGPAFLAAINSGRFEGAHAKVHRFAEGGLVGLPIPTMTYRERMSVGDDNYSERMRPVNLQVFDLKGAVVTEDLLRQMDAKSKQAAEAGARMGFDRVVDFNQRSFGKAFGK